MTFTVELSTSKKQFSCEPHEAVLEAALRQGIVLPYGCKNGACGSCRAQIEQGTVRHGPHSGAVLSDQDALQGATLLCCAYPQSNITVKARELSGAAGTVPKKMPCRIQSIERTSPDVAVIKVQLPANERLQYFAGQYVEFILRDGKRRAYSIATPPHVTGPIELHIRHMPGGAFTDTVFGVEGVTALKEKDLLRLEAPLGTFFLRQDSTKPIVLLASGTGFAPIKAIMEHMIEQQRVQGKTAANCRKTVLYWGGRQRADLYMDALAQQWAQEHADWFSYVPVLSEAQAADAWAGRTGFVHLAVMQDFPDLSGHQIYACGAPVMVDSARKDFSQACQLPQEEFYADSFTSAADLAIAQ